MLQIFITIKNFRFTETIRSQYDKIDEVEEAIADLKSQVYELKKNQIDADSRNVQRRRRRQS